MIGTRIGQISAWSILNFGVSASLHFVLQAPLLPYPSFHPEVTDLICPQLCQVSKPPISTRRQYS